jgi:hypothetical protein
MAIRDPHRTDARDRANVGWTMLPLALAAILAFLLGWWFFSNTSNEAGTRTSAPVTGKTDTNRTNSPGTSTTKPQ